MLHVSVSLTGLYTGESFINAALKQTWDTAQSVSATEKWAIKRITRQFAYENTLEHHWIQAPAPAVSGYEVVDPEPFFSFLCVFPESLLLN